MSIRFKPKSSSGGGIPATLIDAAGDLIVGSAADTAARLPGSATTGDVLKRNTAAALGLEWGAAAAASGGGALYDPAFTRGLKAVTVDPLNAANGMVAADGVLHGCRLGLPADQSIASVVFTVTGAGATFTAGEENRIGLYRISDGALVAATGDLATQFATVGEYAVALTAEATMTLAPLPAGAYFIGVLKNATTRPQMRGQNQTDQRSRDFGYGAVAGVHFSAVAGSGLTALPAVLPALTSNAISPLMGLV